MWDLFIYMKRCISLSLFRETFHLENWLDYWTVLEYGVEVSDTNNQIDATNLSTEALAVLVEFAPDDTVLIMDMGEPCLPLEPFSIVAEIEIG